MSTKNENFFIPPKRNETSARNTPFTIIVEGNIASGKSTFLNYFAQDSNVKVFFEPVSDWTNFQGENLLKLAYDNPKEWGTTFHSYVQLSLSKIHNQTQNEPIKIMERSIYSAKYCFHENLFRNQYISKVNYALHEQWFDWIRNYSNVVVDLCVYLKTVPEIAFHRAKFRARSEEFEVPFETFRALHNLHEEWLKRETHFPVYEYNANCLSNMRSIYEDVIRKTTAF